LGDGGNDLDDLSDFGEMLCTVDVISSAPVATLFRFVVTCWVAVATVLACAEVSSALLLICWLVAANCCEAVESACAFCAIDFMLSCNVSAVLLVAAPTPAKPSMQALRLFLMVLKSPL
jgi:hypothetical protein